MNLKTVETGDLLSLPALARESFRRVACIPLQLCLYATPSSSKNDTLSSLLVAAIPVTRPYRLLRFLFAIFFQ
jgi:hypothetical protein